MVSCVFPGSFDPVTKGHLDLIERASGIFDHVTVTVMLNIHKNGTIPIDKRIEILQRVCTPFKNVSIDSWDGLLAEYMAENHERIIIRGIRSGMEMEHELVSGAANIMLNDQVETLFLPTDPTLKGVSSSAVREIAAFGGDIRKFVPETVAEEIRKLLLK